MNNIFVGNLSFQATKEDLIKLFEPFGSVANAVIMERKKGKSRGYGFVDMPDEEQKNAAITALAGKEFMWRVLSVSAVIPKIKGEASKKFKPVKKEWKPAKEWKPSEKKTVVEAKSPSKYYDKFDGPPKPWRKVNSSAKPSHVKDKGSRPYYGKSDRDSKPAQKGNSSFYRGDERPAASEGRREASPKPPYKKFDRTSKPYFKKDGVSKSFSKPTGGFKMSHKVSGIAKGMGKKGGE